VDDLKPTDVEMVYIPFNEHVSVKLDFRVTKFGVNANYGCPKVVAVMVEDEEQPKALNFLLGSLMWKTVACLSCRFTMCRSLWMSTLVETK